jgi:hypothetical protein
MNAGADYDTLFLAGGGAYYFEEIIKALIPRVELVSDAELANAAGYLELACELATARPTIWEHND